jgi:hypothetical protein
MRENFTLTRNNKKITLMDYFLNNEGDLEFSNSDLFSYSGARFVFLDETSELAIIGLNKDIRVKLEKKEAEAMLQTEISIKKSLNKLYKDILTGDEKLICFPTGLEDYPLHITTETIINEGLTSPKFVKALIFATTDDQLSKAGYSEKPGFENYGDLQSRLGKHISSKGLTMGEYINSEAFIITLKEALKGI